MLLASCLTARAAAPSDAWTLTYDMDRVPALGGWFGSTAEWRVEDGILRIVDPSSTGGEACMFQIPWQAVPAQEAVAELRMRVVRAQGDAGVAIWVSNGVNEEGVQFQADGVNLAFSKLTYDMDTTDDFHVYRVAVKGNDFQLYVDGRLAIDGTGTYTHAAHKGRNNLSFGSASSTATGESLWDWVRLKSPLKVQPVRRPPEMEHIAIFQEPDTYAVFPGLRHDKDTDRLSVGFRAGGPRSHINAKGSRHETRASDDGGRTWHEGSSVPPAYFTGPDGRLISVACKWWQHHPAEERERLEKIGYKVERVRDGVVGICAGALWRWSDDAGATWQTKDIDLPFTALLASGMNSIQLDDGVICFPAYGAKTADAPDSSWLLRSPDYGATWDLIEVATHPDGKTHLNEPAILSLRSGRLLVVMRTGGGRDHLWQAISDDKGVTWHSLRDTGVKGHPPDLLQLQDGRVLLTCGFRHLPYGIRAAVSSDDGETWQTDSIWTLRDDGGGADLGYPHSTQLKDGTIVTVYYYHERGGMQYIACTRWRAPAAENGDERN